MESNSCLLEDHTLHNSRGDKRTYGLLKRWWELQKLRMVIAEERRVLATLSERELKDAGIDPTDAWQESRRRYSDVPASRTARDVC